MPGDLDLLCGQSLEPQSTYSIPSLGSTPQRMVQVWFRRVGQGQLRKGDTCELREDPRPLNDPGTPEFHAMVDRATPPQCLSLLLPFLLHFLPKMCSQKESTLTSSKVSRGDLTCHLIRGTSIFMGFQRNSC
jgi:hypothetical protein